MENLPIYLSFFFGLIVLVTLVWMYQACKSKTFLMVAIAWIILQSVIAIGGVFQDTVSMPPRLILFGVMPTVVIIIITLITKKGRSFMDSFHLPTLTYFHTVRLPVEIMLTLLYHYGVVSVYMTVEGTNFDLFSGISAPIVAYLIFRRKSGNKKFLLAWNIVCLLLLINVVVTAIFAFPSPFQKLAFDQPNVAVMFFPFSLLPTLIVPAVFFAHLVSIRQLIRRDYIKNTSF